MPGATSSCTTSRAATPPRRYAANWRPAACARSAAQRTSPTLPNAVAWSTRPRPQLGGLDVLVNNAGSLVARKKFEEADEAFWAEVMQLNLDSARWVTLAALPYLVDAGASRGGASVVNLSSVAGRHGGGPGAIAYSTAKGAMLTLTRGLASEYAPKGVRVNAVTPGLILGSAFHAQHTPEETQRKIIAGIPLGRAGTTEDVARAVVYLASEFDGFITGATLDINGGVYLM